MNRKKIIFINGTIGLASQIVAQVLQFLLRRYILKYVGVEVLGISSTFASVVSAISFAEMGFQQAVVFYLYNPLIERDTHKINSTLTVLKRVYEGIGGLFIAGAIILTPFLKHILKGIVVDKVVIAYYVLFIVNTAIPYMLSYRRSLLYADQKGYILQIVDSCMNLFMSLLKFVAICRYKNYILFLIVQVLQTIFSNVVINWYCRRRYSYLSIEKFDYNIFKYIIGDVKNVIVSQIAGYIYNATDNLIVSGFIGTIQVGYLTNYTLFTTALKQIVSAIFNNMTPIIGNMLIEDCSIKKRENDFRFYAYIRYLIATVVIVPWVLLGNELIHICFGEQYIVDNNIIVMLAIDLYIHITYSMCCEYINGSGFFKIDKQISVIGAITNLGISMILVRKMGVTGVILGTVISQIVFWIGRSMIVYFKILKMGKYQYMRYIGENCLWIVVVYITIVISRLFGDLFEQKNVLVAFIQMFFACEILNVLIQTAMLCLSNRRKRFLGIIKNSLPVTNDTKKS